MVNDTITTALGITLEVSFVGLTNDDMLMMGVVDTDLRKLFDIFTNPDHTSRLVHFRDWAFVTDKEKVYDGYIIFDGIYRDSDGTTIIRLAKK